MGVPQWCLKGEASAQRSLVIFKRDRLAAGWNLREKIRGAARGSRKSKGNLNSGFTQSGVRSISAPLDCAENRWRTSSHLNQEPLRTFLSPFFRIYRRYDKCQDAQVMGVKTPRKLHRTYQIMASPNARIYRSDRCFIILILLYLFLLYTPAVLSRLVSQEEFLKGDCVYYQAVIVSLIDDHDLLIANNISGDLLNGQLALGKNGFVPKHPIFMSFVSVPFFILFGSHGLLFFNIINCALLIVTIFKINRLFFSDLTSLVTSILYASCTLFLDYVYNYSPDVFSSVFVLVGLYLVMIGRCYVGAFLLGLSVFAKVANAPIAGVIVLSAGFVESKKERLSSDTFEHLWQNIFTTFKSSVVFLAALTPFFLTNYLLFGSPFETGYQLNVVAGSTTDEIMFRNHADRFNQPLLMGVCQILFAPTSGIIVTNPILYFAFLGFFSSKKIGHSKKIALICIICLIQLLFYAKYDYWYLSHFSNRFLMTFIALTSVFVSNYLECQLFKELKNRLT
jgi:hypothetical protein